MNSRIDYLERRIDRFWDHFLEHLRSRQDHGFPGLEARVANLEARWNEYFSRPRTTGPPLPASGRRPRPTDAEVDAFRRELRYGTPRQPDLPDDPPDDEVTWL